MTHEGPRQKTVTVYVPVDWVEEARRGVETYREFKRLGAVISNAQIARVRWHVTEKRRRRSSGEGILSCAWRDGSSLIRLRRTGGHAGGAGSGVVHVHECHAPRRQDSDVHGPARGAFAAGEFALNTPAAVDSPAANTPHGDTLEDYLRTLDPATLGAIPVAMVRELLVARRLERFRLGGRHYLRQNNE